jgi:hypothetical protein
MFASNWIYNNFNVLGNPVKIFLFAYFSISSIISTIFIYVNGPITNSRYTKIIELLLKLASLSCMFMSVTNNDVIIIFLFVFLICIVIYIFKLFISTVVSFFFKWLFPTKKKFISLEEYAKQADEFTLRELRELQNYCLSPDCNSWRIISRLNTPDR